MPDKATAAEPQGPGPHVTLADLEAQAAELAAERDALATAHAEAVARVKQLEDNLQAYGGAQQAVERMIAKAKEPPEPPPIPESGHIIVATTAGPAAKAATKAGPAA